MREIPYGCYYLMSNIYFNTVALSLLFLPVRPLLPHHAQLHVPLHLFATVAFCNQACSALPTATTVRSRPSLTHPLTLPAITYFAPRRPITTCSHHSTCDLQRYRVRSHYFAATVATYRAAYCQLSSVPPSLPLYTNHLWSICPSLTTIIFSARRYSHYIMHHYFYYPVYFNDQEIIPLRNRSCNTAALVY